MKMFDFIKGWIHFNKHDTVLHSYAKIEKEEDHYIIHRNVNDEMWQEYFRSPNKSETFLNFLICVNLQEQLCREERDFLDLDDNPFFDFGIKLLQEDPIAMDMVRDILKI